MKKRGRTLAVGVGAIVLGAGYWRDAFRSLASTGYGDWQMVHHNWEAGWVALTRFGEWPLWDPFHCGGVTILGNPESQHWSPLFLLALVLGPTTGVKIFLVLHASAGLAGMYVLARAEYALGFAAAFLVSVAWCCGGFFAWQGSGGHATFLPFYFAPWLVLAWRRAVVDPRYIVAVAVLLVLVLLEGGTYPFPYFCVLLALEAVYGLGDRARRSGTVRAALLGATLTGLLGSVRLLPILQTLREAPRALTSTDTLALPEVVAMLTARDHEYRWSHEYVWAEYGSYMGWAVVALALAGCFFAWTSGRRHLVIGVLLFGALMLGHRGSLYPWPILRELPVFDSLRAPSRFASLFTFHVALLAGVAFDAARRSGVLGKHPLRQPLESARRALAPAVAMFIAVDIFVVTAPVLARWDRAPVDTSDPASRFHLVDGSNYSARYASYPRQNIGTAACYVGAMNWRISRALWTGDVEQARIASASAGDRGARRTRRVIASGRTTSAVWADVMLEEPSRVVFNQNAASGWVTSVGKVVGDEGRLAVDVPRGRHRVLARYRPAVLWWGLAGTAAGAALAAMVARFLTVARAAGIGYFVRRILGIRPA